MQLYDSKGLRRISLHVDENGDPEIFMTDRKNNARIGLDVAGDRASVTVTAYADYDYSSSVGTGNKVKGLPIDAVAFSSSKNASPHFFAADTTGMKRTAIAGASVVVRDEAGRARIIMAHHDDRSQVSVSTPSGTKEDRVAMVAADDGTCGVTVRGRDGRSAHLLPQ
jgi:hypothetical protein